MVINVIPIQQPRFAKEKPNSALKQMIRNNIITRFLPRYQQKGRDPWVFNGNIYRRQLLQDVTWIDSPKMEVTFKIRPEVRSPKYDLEELGRSSCGTLSCVKTSIRNEFQSYC